MCERNAFMYDQILHMAALIMKFLYFQGTGFFSEGGGEVLQSNHS